MVSDAEENEELLHEVKEELNREIQMAERAENTGTSGGAFKKYSGIILFAIAVVGAAWGGAAYLFVTDKTFKETMAEVTLSLMGMDKDFKQLRKELDELNKSHKQLIIRHGQLDRRVIRLEVKSGMEKTSPIGGGASGTGTAASPPPPAAEKAPEYKSKISEKLIRQYKR